MKGSGLAEVGISVEPVPEQFECRTCGFHLQLDLRGQFCVLCLADGVVARVCHPFWRFVSVGRIAPLAARCRVFLQQVVIACEFNRLQFSLNEAASLDDVPRPAAVFIRQPLKQDFDGSLRCRVGIQSHRPHRGGRMVYGRPVRQRGQGVEQGSYLDIETFHVSLTRIPDAPLRRSDFRFLSRPTE